MIKLTMIGVFLLKGFLISGYFAFFHGRGHQVNTKLLQDTGRESAEKINSFIVMNPNENLNEMVTNLNWIIRNDYQRDIRVRRVIHQDLHSLVEMSHLYEKLDRPDTKTLAAYQAAITTITDRTVALRKAKDQTIRDEILLIGKIIERNDR